jgi:hypothetical protein
MKENYKEIMHEISQIKQNQSTFVTNEFFGDQMA